MKHVDTGGAHIGYQIDGTSDAPPILFINSIGTTRELWSAQVAALSPRYRVISYDARGHGRSSGPAGDYTIERLGHDALAILDDLGLASAHVCGISLGGLTAMSLALREPTRVRSLVLANTAARIGSVESWTERIALVHARGMAGVAERGVPLWFSAAFREARPATVRDFTQMLEACPTTGYLGCCAALRDEDLREAISAIRCPVLCVAGSGDVPTPPAALQFVHERVAGSSLVTLEAAHLSNVEQSEAFNEALLAFLVAHDVPGAS
jgi:3-oxoadipate enol-lactonase